MFDDTGENRAQAALRAGLSDLPTPQLSADFDAAIQAALQEHPLRPRDYLPAWLPGLWTACRPAVPAAALSLCATLLLLNLVQHLPVSLPTPASGTAGANGQAGSRGQSGTRTDAFENTSLTDASLRLFSRPTHRGRNQSG